MTVLAYKIPDSLVSEIDELESLISLFTKNEISEAQLKAHRVPFGVYEQRQKGLYMVRVRCTAGIITPLQLKGVAELSLRYASGSLHITTRQEIQIHDVALTDLVPIIRALKEMGLSTRGGGGNTVRNITAPCNSGITSNEVFDVAPYAVALTSVLIARNDSWLLPRKYKIAFSNFERDNVFASINDLGFVAQIKDGEKGFKVFVAGGMGRLSQPGHLLHDFVPASEILIIAEAIKRLFSKYGNRKNKHAARLRYVWNTLGKDQFVAIYNQEKNALQEEKIGVLSVQEIQNAASCPHGIIPETQSTPEFAIWKQRYVENQKQDNASTVKIPLLFGIIDAKKAKDLAAFLILFGENTIRFTHDQNIVLRNIDTNYIGNVYAVVKRITDLALSPSLFGNAIACAGASTCQLGICRSRGLLGAVIDHLKMSNVYLDNLGDLRIHISGCSNTCGQHVIADIGFYGKVGRKDQHSYPLYTIVGGGKTGCGGNTVLAEKIDEINAHDLPLLLEELLQHYSVHKNRFSDFLAYLNSEGAHIIKELSDKYREIPSFDIDRSYYRDYGDTEIFSLAGKGTGECSAGLFDLIEIDLSRLKSVRTEIAENAIDSLHRRNKLYDLALVSSRMLLITKGVEATDDKHVFDHFLSLFIDGKLIDKKYASAIRNLRDNANSLEMSLQNDIVELSYSIEKLYASMDNSLQFKVDVPLANSVVAIENESQNAIKINVKKDFTGVACPMNFVKTKMALSQMQSGQILEILLDDGAPIDNVPKSVAEEGHVIISQERMGDSWVVRIEKKQEVS